MTSIAQINMGRGRIATAELKEISVTKKIALALIQEPYARKGKVEGMGADVRCLTANKPDSNPWACIAVFDRNVDAMVITELSDDCCVCAEITGTFGKIILVSIYCRMGGRMEDETAKIQKIVDRLPGRRILLGGDVNARNGLWGSAGASSREDARRTRERGRVFEECIASNNLLVLNEAGQPATFGSSQGESDIDVTFVSDTLYGKIQDWRVSPGVISSDHRLITWILLPEQFGGAPKEKSDRYNSTRANWPKFKARIENSLTVLSVMPLQCRQHIEALSEEIERTIIEAAKASMPLKKGYAKSVPWWNRDLTKHKMRVNRLRKRAQRARGTDLEVELKTVYQEARREYTKCAQKSRTRSWRQFVTTESRKDTFGGPYKVLMNKLPCDTVLHSIKRGEDSTDSWESSARALLDELVPDNVADERDEAAADRLRRAYNGPRREVRWSTETVRKAIKRLPNKKAPGMDGIDARMLKKAAEGEMGQILTKLFNECLKQGVFPRRWKRGLVRTLLKAPGKDPSKTGSYRPVCLLSLLGKVLERLLKLTLSESFLKEASERQFGFRAGKSTEDAVVRIREAVRSDKKYALGIFFDIRGAFNNLWWPRILESMREKDCNSKALGLLSDYLNDRTAVIQGRYHRVEKQVSKGCPQGSILGPELWNLVLDDLLTKLEEKIGGLADRADCDVVAYADDIAAVIAANSRLNLEKVTSEIGQVIADWCREAKLELATEKTQMLLMKGELPSRDPWVKIDGNLIRLEKEVKYLGVTFSVRCGITEHIEAVIGKCSVIFNKFGAVSRATWGLSYRCLRQLYKAIFLSVITYGAAGWSDRMTQVHRKRLLTAQRGALLRTTRAYRTISTDALMVIAGEIPIDLVLEERVLKYKVRKNKACQIGEINFIPGGDRIKAVQEIETMSLTKWERRWSASTKGQETRRYFPRVQDRMRQPWIELNHYSVQFLSGHGDFREKLYSFNLCLSEICECGEVDSPQHLIEDCAVFVEERRELQEKLEPGEWPPSPQDLVKDEYFAAFTKFTGKVLRRRNETRKGRA